MTSEQMINWIKGIQECKKLLELREEMKEDMLFINSCAEAFPTKKINAREVVRLLEAGTFARFGPYRRLGRTIGIFYANKPGIFQ